MIIGLAGSYCAGKNHVAAILSTRGLPVLDVDKLGHVCLENQKAAVFARFGDEVKAPDGSVNRKALGAKVFGNKTEMAALEAIVHPEANRMTMEWVTAFSGTAEGGTSTGGKTCVVNAALLHKSAVFDKLDCIILVRAPWLVRLVRARGRDKLPWIDLLRRLSSQKQFTSQYLAGNADIYIVENPGIGKPVSSQRSDHGKPTRENGLEQRIDEILAKLKPET
ncbi:MAG: dephospho-CoA kinase [Treponema sp.]|nr:dephospho-CoA kinase [Treponema sp.]